MTSLVPSDETNATRSQSVTSHHLLSQRFDVFNGSYTGWGSAQLFFNPLRVRCDLRVGSTIRIASARKCEILRADGAAYPSNSVRIRR